LNNNCWSPSSCHRHQCKKDSRTANFLWNCKSRRVQSRRLGHQFLLFHTLISMLYKLKHVAIVSAQHMFNIIAYAVQRSPCG
jgi:hypothetical protein